ncbi:hypothetical protein [Halomonas sp. AOP43-D1-4]|uniref:hypothetical protein n=1 Tax=Halomonas sp. AOP43-D1-4 TaxID=3457658 RepID=UPI0040343524
MQAPILINEPLLTPDMKRTWSGATQLFRKDYKDRQFTSEETLMLFCVRLNIIYLPS